MPHPRLGTLTKSLDVVTAASVLLVLTSAGRVAWLAGAYATAIGVTVALRAVAIARLRKTGVDGLPAPGPAAADSSRPGAIGPTIVALAVASATAFMLARGEGAWLAAAALVLGLTLLLSRQSQRAQDEGLGEAEGFELLASSAIAVEDARAQPGNILVAVRHPHALEHVAAALQGGADREVVVMTVRLHGVDTDGASPDDPTPLPAERYLFARVIALVERYGRPVRLLVVPAATCPTAWRRRWSACGRPRSTSANRPRCPRPTRRGCSARPGSASRNRSRSTSGSSSITAAGAPTPITSGRTCRHFTPGDLDLIHRVWRRSHARDRTPRPPPRRRQGGAHAHGRTTERSRSGRGARAHPRHGPARRGAGRRHPGARLHPSPRHGAQSRVQRGGRGAHRPWPRRPGGGLPRPAAQGRGRGLRVPLARIAGSAAQGDGPGGRRGAPERHGPRRSHDVPGRTAGGGDPPAPDAADARRTRRGRQPARLSRGVDRTADDAALRGGPRAVDGARGARLRAPSRTGQRDAEHALRRGRPRRAHRRHPRSASSC